MYLLFTFSILFPIIFYRVFIFKLIEIKRFHYSEVLFFPRFLFLFIAMNILCYKNGLIPPIKKDFIVEICLFLLGSISLYTLSIINDLVKKIGDNNKKATYSFLFVSSLFLILFFCLSSGVYKKICISIFIIFFVYFFIFRSSVSNTWFNLKKLIITILLIGTSGILFLKERIFLVFVLSVLGAISTYFFVLRFQKEKTFFGDAVRVPLLYIVSYLFIIIIYNLP